MAAKFYAVRKGKKPGIYMSWDICKQQTDGFPGAEFKSFPTREAAEEYIGQKQQTVEKEPENYAFVDASMRNVAGEVLGSMAAIEKAVELGLAELTIYYDYMGIEMWATGAWKRNKTGTIAYYDYIQSIKDKITLHFVKVKGHSGVEGNEEADRLAKEAVGIEI